MAEPARQRHDSSDRVVQRLLRRRTHDEVHVLAVRLPARRSPSTGIEVRPGGRLAMTPARGRLPSFRGRADALRATRRAPLSIKSSKRGSVSLGAQRCRGESRRGRRRTMPAGVQQRGATIANSAATVFGCVRAAITCMHKLMH